uniref:Thiamine pyrimidine synthase n=1 Tax=Candidatus Kentrum sp. FW TaxID=2126338 RepID=A0A450SD51_9GAMM|nr:MAG: NitT/TauT family transport system substrate-binding protein [Candidatus Kentron sp. FW]
MKHTLSNSFPVRRQQGASQWILISAIAVLAIAVLLFISNWPGRSEKPGVPVTDVGEASPKMESISTRIKWFTYASYIGTYVAKDWGFWEKLGLDVTIQEGGPQVDATKLVAGGANHFGIAGGDQLLVARSKGLPVVAIAVIMQETPAGFMVLADSDIHGMRDFPGHRIRVVPGHNTEIEYRAVMAKLGIDTDTAMKEVVNFSEFQLLLAGEVDIEPIYLNNQPATARSRDIEFRTFTPTDYGVRSYGNVYFTTEKMIEERPELVQRFLDGLLQGWKGTREQPERAVDSMLKYGRHLKRDVELDKLRDTWPLVKEKHGRIGWMERARWVEVLDVLRTTGIIKSDVDVDAVFDTRFVKTHYRDHD